MKTKKAKKTPDVWAEKAKALTIALQGKRNKARPLLDRLVEAKDALDALGVELSQLAAFLLLQDEHGALLERLKEEPESRGDEAHSLDGWLECLCDLVQEDSFDFVADVFYRGPTELLQDASVAARFALPKGK